MDEVAGNRFQDTTLTKTAKFFIYAPPLFTQRKSKRPLPNAPFGDAERWQTSIYYLWWVYLRRSDAYKETCKKGGKGKLAKLYADFGNVFDDKETEKDTFWSWWKEHAHLFWEKEARQVAEEKDVEDVVDAEDTDLIVRIPMEVRTANIVRQVRRLLSDNETRVRQARAKSRAKYPICSKVKLRSLYAHLYIYDFKLANPTIKNDALVFDAVEKHLKLTVDDSIEVFDKNAKTIGKKRIGWIKRNGFDTYLKQAEDTIKRRKRQIVGKHFKAAKEYIACVEKGLFPCRSLQK
jgi:hypothetical protein